MVPIPWIAVAVLTRLLNPVASPDSGWQLPADTTDAILANDNRAPAGRLANGVLTLKLELRLGSFRPEGADGPSVSVLAFAEAGRPLQIPGPLLRVPQGTDIRVTVRNPFKDSTLTVYGLGSRPLTSDTGVAIPGGAIREIRFRANTPGTYFYWASTSGEKPSWSETQLAGALVIDSPHAAAEDRIFVITGFLREADSSLAVPRPEQAMLAVNGLSWPHTERLTYTQGDSVRWRWINATRVAHPMHLHGFYFHLESRGDWKSEQVYRKDERPFLVTNLMQPRETMRIGWLPERPGNWIFHCHFAFHVSQHLKLRADTGAPVAAPAAKLTSAASSPVAAHGSHARHHEMAGLVMGITVLPGKELERQTTTWSDARNIRLLVQSAPKRFGRLTGFGYVAQEGATEPTRDSILIPGPTIVLRRGQPARITVVNRLAEPTAVHWHGIELQSFPDGVPGWSGSPGRIMPPIAPGDSFVAEFVPPRAGTFIYHAHHNEQLQLGAGLYGALLVVDDAIPTIRRSTGSW
jgi:FtsP/CotA-like multicopper oxidase with cupredoxin domain